MMWCCICDITWLGFRVGRLRDLTWHVTSRYVASNALTRRMIWYDMIWYDKTPKPMELRNTWLSTSPITIAYNENPQLLLHHHQQLSWSGSPSQILLQQESLWWQLSSARSLFSSSPSAPSPTIVAITTITPSPSTHHHQHHHFHHQYQTITAITRNHAPSSWSQMVCRRVYRLRFPGYSPFAPYYFRGYIWFHVKHVEMCISTSGYDYIWPKNTISSRYIQHVSWFRPGLSAYRSWEGCDSKPGRPIGLFWPRCADGWIAMWVDVGGEFVNVICCK